MTGNSVSHDVVQADLWGIILLLAMVSLSFTPDPFSGLPQPAVLVVTTFHRQPAMSEVVNYAMYRLPRWSLATH